MKICIFRISFSKDVSMRIERSGTPHYIVNINARCSLQYFLFFLPFFLENLPRMIGSLEVHSSRTVGNYSRLSQFRRCLTSSILKCEKRFFQILKLLKGLVVVQYHIIKLLVRGIKIVHVISFDFLVVN